MALLKRLIYGIESGTVGGVAMLILFAVASMLNRHVWWEVPNLLGSTFYHSRAFYSGPNIATVAGGALQLTIAGVVGALFRLACGNVPSRHRLILLGTLTGLAWFYLANVLLWPHINPLVPLRWPEPAALLSHLVFGLCLGYGAAFAAVPFAANGPSDAVDL
jgi:hypothetical protein